MLRVDPYVPMADAVAIASVISSATVAIAVPVVAAHFQRRERVLVREQAAVDELRQTLDTAGIALTEALLVLDAVRERLVHGLPARSAADAEVEDRRATDEIWRHETRLAIRLGTSGMCYREYLLAARILHAAMRPDSRGGIGVPATPESLRLAYDNAVMHQNRFFDEARAVLDVAGTSQSVPSQWKIARSPES
jgi:hypothetical protein